MPADWPDYPSAAHMQRYLESYVDRFDLHDRLRLATTVERAEQRQSGGWTVTTSRGDVACDHLVVANGVFCSPFVPAWPGRDDHARAGGVVRAPSQGLALEDARGRHVVVVGYGKSACDVAVALSEVAASVTIVARRLLWKGSKRSMGRDYEDIVLTRLGESAFRHTRRSRLLFSAVQRATIRAQSLEELGLIPAGRFEDIAQGSISLQTDGFTTAVASGAVQVRAGRSVVRLGGVASGPRAVLDDDTTVPADLVVPATGFSQDVPFLSEEVISRLLDPMGDFALYRQILPFDVPDLTFCGYNSSVISALNAEVGATWIAAHLANRITLPDIAQRRGVTADRLRAMRARTEGHHARGTSIVPFSLENIDLMLHDLGRPLPLHRRLRQWVRSATPRDYTDLLGAPAGPGHQAPRTRRHATDGRRQDD